MSEEARTCPECGASIPANAPQGLCPKCLLAGAAAPTEPGTNAGGRVRMAAPTIESIARAFPQLQILGLIGRGGMGFVYRARQPRLERDIALKILPQQLAGHPGFAERFSREGRVLAKLNHPSIVSIFDFGESGGFYYLLMEYVDGVNLRQAMRTSRFTTAQALTIVPAICEALQFAHDEGVLHRDIKPENILIDTKGRVKIADFGIAKLVTPANSCDPEANEPAAEQSATFPKLTATSSTLGTPQYMAPEQIERPAEVDHRADIYSLGVVFYELLTGELPVGRFAPPSAKTPLDERVDEIVLRALAKEREQRQQSARELKTEVETVANGGEAAPPMTDDWRCKVPFQSPEVREIYRHLTVEERRADLRQQAMPLVLSIALMLGFVAALDLLPRDWVAVRLGLLPAFVLVQLALLVVSIDRAKEFLCSTQWAKARGIQPRQLRAFVWPSRRARTAGSVSGAGLPLAFFVALFFTGMVGLVPLVENLGGGHRWLLAATLVWALTVAGLVWWLFTECFREAPGARHERLRSWAANLSVIATVMCLPVCGLGIFFLGSLIDELTTGKDGWNPAVSEAILVPQAVLGLALLPWAVWKLRRTARPMPAPAATAPEIAQVEADPGREQAVGLFLAVGGFVALLLGMFNPWGGVAWKWYTVACVLGWVIIGWRDMATARPASGTTPNGRYGTWLFVGLLSFLLVIAALVWARPPRDEVQQSATDERLAQEPTTDTSEVTIESMAPVVVETKPASGARNVPPGVCEIEVRFSKPMTDQSWSWVEAWPGSTPQAISEPRFDASGRTCTVTVNLAPGRTHAWWLNSAQFKNFKDTGNRSAVPYLLIFQTSKDSTAP